MKKTIKVNGGTVEMTYKPSPSVELTIRQQMMDVRIRVLDLETRLFRMLHPKDSKDCGFLPPGNEIKFNFGKKTYNDILYDIKVSIKDLQNIESLAENINKL
tara:strand:- start:580 stop:885 length:306 start_codon:yes stop_codon:yes gene_type:complete